MKTIAVAFLLMFSEVVLARLPQQVPQHAPRQLADQAPKEASRQITAADNAELAKLVKAQTEAIKALSARVKALEERVTRLESKR